MSRGKWLILGQLVAIGLLVEGLPVPGAAQGLRTAIEPRERVFPAVGAGVTAIKRDSSGRYYVLAKPESVISVYGPDGNLVDRFPNSKSNGATIRYAVDIDVGPSGNLVVADRGSNALDVFAPDGSLLSRIPVVAPTSVVALADNQYAVASLTSKRLVQVVDQRGRIVRTFGDPIEVEDAGGEPAQPEQSNKEKDPLQDFGRISGDSTGDIYFAFTSVADPTVRKYDRFGYLGYQASIPEAVFGEGSARPADRVQFSFGFSDMSFSSQTSAFLTVGSSSDVQFGAGVGAGFGEAMRRGLGYGQAIQQQTMPNGGGPLGAMFTGQVSSQGTDFQLGMGRMGGFGGRGGRGRGGGGFGSVNDQTTGQNSAALKFNASGSGSDLSDFSQPSSSIDPSNMTAQLQSGPFDSSSTGTPNASGVYTGPPMPGGFGPGQGGLPSSFVLGSALNSFAFRPRETQGLLGAFQGLPGAADTASGTGSAPDAGHSAGARAGAHNSAGASHFDGGYRGRFSRNSFGFTGAMRVNLGDLGRVSAFDRPIITAMAADAENHEIWAGIGDTLVHFSRDGSPVGIYYLTLNGGTPVKPVAVLVETDRILIAADPWGIFEFARPDKPLAAPPKQQLEVVPQVVPPPQPR